jgi:hypothetical protein
MLVSNIGIRDTPGKSEVQTIGFVHENKHSHHQITGFCPGFSECRVFSAGMKIVIDKILKIPFGSVFEGFLTWFYELYRHI